MFSGNQILKFLGDRSPGKPKSQPAWPCLGCGWWYEIQQEEERGKMEGKWPSTEDPESLELLIRPRTLHLYFQQWLAEERQQEKPGRSIFVSHAHMEWQGLWEDTHLIPKLLFFASLKTSFWEELSQDDYILWTQIRIRLGILILTQEYLVTGVTGTGCLEDGGWWGEGIHHIISYSSWCHRLWRNCHHYLEFAGEGIGILMNKVKEIFQDNSSGFRVSEMSKTNRVGRE